MMMASSQIQNFILAVVCLMRTCVSSSPISCPGSPSIEHAKCAMDVVFPYTNCDVVQAEIVARMMGVDGWEDPHNLGSYSPAPIKSGEYISDGLRTIWGSRITGDGKYTDVFGFTLSENEGKDGCRLSACSESQVHSRVDYSTNYCNLRSLYCNTIDGCPIVESDLQYEEAYVDCEQREKELCIHRRSDA